MTLWVTSVPFISCTVALYMGKLDGPSYVNFLQWTIPLSITAFCGANVAQKIGLAKHGVTDVE